MRRLLGDAAIADDKLEGVEEYHPLFANPHLNTIVGRYWPVRLEPGELRIFETEPGVRVLARCHWRGGGRPLMLLVHGLEGSAESTYMRWMAKAALVAGFDAVRLNVRNCGDTEHLCPTLYHSGLTADLAALVRRFCDRRLFLVGFSMGGNQVLKLAGEWAQGVPEHVGGVCAVSAPIDLAAGARRLDEPRNRIYRDRFLRSLRARVRRKAKLWPGRYSAAGLERVRSIVEFDHRVTAPAFGFRDAWDYYQQASARPRLASICVPALVIQARDDPFVPFESYQDFPASRFLRLVAPDRGGHVSFLSRTRPRFWAARQVLRFCQAHVQSALLSHR